ncbi:glycine betaine/L-proline ABC transporter ATP-binding protein ProV [Xenorhabdus sp. 18]|uniref:glycine betaine/L-proline ABC transporter ATP-binding protein ProV n=1 Tax=Xenorhabdus doucetiae TaxID=351671 RepID=UPI00198B9CE0|nr:glycine betaine/L-proline ABC transporter ATP-binding protein ProV [Xenorhabdus sp. 18]MBD2795443.1 glycine betaine/L-proline ABC transporter ATP-binding protein ProV [Xenorhabdus sp. 18]
MTIKLEVKNLYKIFGDNPEPAFQLLAAGLRKEQIFEKTGLTVGVQDVNLAIEEGEIFVIMGLSGSGKSTLVRLLNRLIKPTKGHVLIDGEDISAITETQLLHVRRNKISMVFQSFALMPHLNILENTAFGMELAGIPKEERHQTALETLKQVNLESYALSYPDELSGGMQQRIGLARALANNPDILLMDEAFSALDPLIRTEMQDELLRLQGEHQRTVVFISHDLDEAMRIGDRIAIMQGGVVVQIGTPDEIMNKPANDYVKTFFRGVDISHVFSAKDIARRQPETLLHVATGFDPRTALKVLDNEDRNYGYLIEKGQKFVGVVSVNSLQQALAEEKSIKHAILEKPTAVAADIPLNELISTVAQSPCAVPVVSDNSRYLGVISKGILLQALDKEAPNEQ